MNCHESQTLVADHLSGELRKGTARKLQQHLATCAACTQQLAAETALRASLREAVDEKPSNALRLRIRSTIAQLEAERVSFATLAHRMWPQITAVATAVAVLALFAVYWLAAPPQIMADSVKMHRQFIFAGFLGVPIKVPEILAWSEKQLGYSVPQPVMVAMPNSLLSGGICPLVNQRAAYLTYNHRGRVVSLFMLRHQEHDLRGTERKVLGGTEYFVARVNDYNVVLWDYQGVACTLVSDLPQPELIKIASKIFLQPSETSTAPMSAAPGSQSS